MRTAYAGSGWATRERGGLKRLSSHISTRAHDGEAGRRRPVRVPALRCSQSMRRALRLFMAHASAIVVASSAAPPVTPTRAMKLRHLVQAPLLADDSLDVPGILWLEHLNIIVGPREEANTFFCDFLGCVPQPGRSWHVNLGSQQFHLGNGGEPHVLTGSVSLALPSLQALRGRVAAASSALSHTRFAVDDHGDHIAVTCPWGSQYLCWDAALPPVVEAERSADAPALAIVPLENQVQKHKSLEA